MSKQLEISDKIRIIRLFTSTGGKASDVRRVFYDEALKSGKITAERSGMNVARPCVQMHLPSRKSIERINRTFDETVVRAITGRVQKCIAENGGHFEGMKKK